MKIIKPDYHNCGLNVVSSILKYFDVSCTQPTHPFMDRMLEKGYRNIVFMLFDGMGMDVINRFLPEDSYIRTHIAKELTAVYPSTTTNATTSLECAQAPVEHAWLGWTLYFDEINKPVDIFLNKSNGEPAAEYDVAWEYIPKVSLFEKFANRDDVAAISISAFSDEYYAENMQELFSLTNSVCHKPGKHYVYTYWNEPDHTMHGEGCSSVLLSEILREIDDRTRALAESLPEDTLLLLTADHGLIDARHHYLDDHPRIAEMIKHVPTIEARAASFHVKEEYMDVFPQIFREEYGENFLLMNRKEFTRDYLGNGKMHKKVCDFVGDYMALATDHDCIDKYRSDFELKGVHAGLTEREMIVPLIVAKK